MTGQAKIELILEMKERVTSGIAKAKKAVNQNVNEIKSNITDWKNHHIKAFRAMRDEVPLLDKALRMLKNPYVLLAAGVVGLGVAFTNSTKRAAEFNHEFLNIRQLNLDKSNEELDKYRSKVRDVAFDVGLSSKDTAKAFYDIQSATGLYGQDVADITKKVGKFSIATGAELPDAVNQTVKAMKAMGLGVQDIDAMLDSNAKTVQVGITTFKELAQYQTEFLGAAAGAGQSLDTANKVFAAFTSIAKDSRTAATMTKTAFEGLTQRGTIEGLKSMGISMYDATGNMRNLSDVLKETSERFKGMTSEQIDAIIAKIGGPEGLRNLFIKLKTGADDFFNTLEAYDDSAFNLDKAMENAKGDFTILSNMARDRLGTIMERIGEKFLPLWVVTLEKFNNVLKFVWANLDTITTSVKWTVGALGAAKVAMLVFNAVAKKNPFGLIYMLIVGIVGLVTILVKKWEHVKKAINIVWESAKRDWEFLRDTIAFGITKLQLKFKSFGQYIKGLFKNVGQAIKLAFQGDFSGAKEALTKNIVTDASQELEQLKKLQEANRTAYYMERKLSEVKLKNIWNDAWKKKSDEEESSDAEVSPFSTDNNEAPNSLNGGIPTQKDLGINKITGSAKQIRNITINIDALNKGNINTENTTLQRMDAQELEEWFSKMLMRVVRNTELSY
jgi:TP901 family phage tail tape measure protein